MKTKLTGTNVRSVRTKMGKTGYLLLDITIKFLTLWPLGVYTSSQSYQTLPWVLGAVSMAWIAATAFLALGKIMLVGIKKIHEES